MIEVLRISSLAIFDEVELELEEGLNCITGETGAGKSLVLNALTLLMGARAGRDLVRPGRDRCAVEALFATEDGETVLRREVTASGQSRCYIDGRLATLAQLAGKASELVHIYGQHDYQDLLLPRQQMAILEETAGLSRLEAETAYREYRDALESLMELRERIRSASEDRSYLEHCLAEIRSAGIEEGLEESLERELHLARKAASLRESAQAAEELLYSGSPSLADMASRVRQILQRISKDDPLMEDLAERMGDIGAALADAYELLRTRIERYEADPQRIDDIAQRLDRLRSLMRKHKTDEAGLIALEREFDRRLSLIDDPSVALDSAQKEVARALEKYRDTLHAFLSKRWDAAAAFCRAVSEDLEGLGMKGCVLEVDQVRPQELGSYMLDDASEAKSPAQIFRGEFLVSTNIGQRVLPLARVASGGELSRIMLAIKAHQNKVQTSTLVFDEVDAGTSGQSAIAVASRLKEIASRCQALVVTHLHQVASLADVHFHISKETRGGKTTSLLKRLHGHDRVMELARMMGGDDPSPTVIEHARELVMNPAFRHKGAPAT
ncbi:MAG TPA: AAA family ATPase [Deltaproteobacteria bacterium]|nr:AAA family ATPase [Deltaproteobacteria bacterium]